MLLGEKGLVGNPHVTLLLRMAYIFNLLPAIVSDYLIRLSEIPHLTVQGPYNRRIHLFKYRKDLVPEHVSLVFRREIGAVIAIAYAVGKSETLDLLSGHVKKRTDKSGGYTLGIWQRRDGRHSGKSLHSGASKKIQQQSLCIVIRVMSNSDFIISLADTQFGKPPVSKFSGSHFHAYTMFTGKSFRIK